jgi:two-component SAPR family response regulator
VLHEGRVTLDRRYFWVDIWDFDSLAAEAEGCTDGHRVEKLAEHMLELYRGPLLAGEDAPWQIAPRERLRARLARTMARVMRQWQDSGQPERAQAYQEKLIFNESVSDR